MTKQSEKDILIEKFLTHNLSESELRLFKEKWENDPEFVQEVRDYARLAITLKGVKELKENDASPQSPTKGRQIRLMINYWTIAAAVVLLFVTAPLYMAFRSPSSKKMAQEYFIDYRLYQVRGDSSGRGTSFENVLRAYSSGQKQEAIDLMRLVETQRNEAYFFTLADLFLEAGEPDSAVYYYQKGRALNPTDPYAQWNSIMAQLHKGNVDKAKTTLVKLAGSGEPPYDEKAKTLLQVLNNPGFKIRSWFE